MGGWSITRFSGPRARRAQRGGGRRYAAGGLIKGSLPPVSTRRALPTPATSTALLLAVLAPFALGYFLSYLFRAVNAVVGPHLAADLDLSAAGLGLLTSAYLFAFALFQLPLGLLLDRFGPRRVQAALLACAAAGSLLSRSAKASRRSPRLVR